MKVDWLIVGAGYTGCTLAERVASVFDESVLVIDRRDHIGGNAFDHLDDNGVLVHKYGPHLFHTNFEKVWKYLSRFTEWRPYSHHVRAQVDGITVPVPFNLNSLHALFPAKRAERLEDLLLGHFGMGAKVPILKMIEHSNPELRTLAEYVYEKVFYGYTVKQWDLTPQELSPSVTGRVPVHISRDDRYFQDTYQAMPAQGYTTMFERILDHPNIRVMLNAEYEDVVNDVTFSKLVYSGAVDAFFGYTHGELPYRSLRFDFVHHPDDQYQEVGQVNYPNEFDYTRITEFKHFTGPPSRPGTTVAVEYPMQHVRGETEPYYPIPRDENRDLYARYEQEMAELRGSVLFAGRLADYKYYNMDQAVARALMVFDAEAASR